MKQFFNTIVKSVVLCLFFFNFSNKLNAQITIDNSLTTEQIVQSVLLGQGITVSNITLNGSALSAQSTNTQIGTFTNGNSSFPINSGIILSTGRVQDAPRNIFHRKIRPNRF